jgi:hypothetical protein
MNCRRREKQPKQVAHRVQVECNAQVSHTMFFLVGLSYHVKNKLVVFLGGHHNI